MQEVIRRAQAWFGPQGLGLNLLERGEGCVHFEGGGGFVTVTACPEKGGTRVELLAREWEGPAREFASSLG